MLALLAVGVAGCASAKVLPPAGNTAYGVYQFKANVTGTRPMQLEGSVALLPDTVTMSLKGYPCTPGVNQRNNTRGFSYSCGNMSFYFDRQNPLRQNSFVTTTSRWVTNRVCILWAPNRTGGETCTRYGTEREERTVPVYGKLELVAR